MIIALTQFVFIALGTLTINILIKAEGYPYGDLSTYPRLSVFLANNGIWLLIIPIVWAALAVAIDALRKPLAARALNSLGTCVTTAIFLVYAAAVFLHF